MIRTRYAVARQTHRRIAWLLALAALLVLVALPPAAQAKEKKFTVMTRNLYAGTGVDNLLGKTGLAFISAVTQDWNNAVATNFPARAEALANEIQAAQPDLVGLQEVTIWREQKPADSFVNPTPNASTTVYNFLDLLRAALQARGLNYEAVAISSNADAEAPRFDPTSPNGFTDVRLTDRDVILAKSDLVPAISNSRNGHYAVQLTVPAGGQPVQFTRGWTSVDVTLEGGAFRFFNTHLETEAAAPIQVLQGNEALALMTASPIPVVAVGDYNSAADGSTTPTYANLTGQLADAWRVANTGAPGPSCCQNELLTSSNSLATGRIDLVLTLGRFQVQGASLTGATPFQATAPLWASDHFGVVADLKIK